MKNCGAIGVPRNPPKMPWYCQPLPASSPPGAVVFAAGSPVPAE
jgi:hypothetical protein